MLTKKLQTIKLGGWHRLWIILSFLYLIIIIFFTVDQFPKNPSDIDGPYKVLKLMNPDNAQHIVEILKYKPSSTDGDKEFNIYTAETESGYFLKIHIPSEMISNDIIYNTNFDVQKAIDAGYNQEEIDDYLKTQTPFTKSISSEFDLKIPKLLSKQRAMAIITGFLAWGIPAGVLYFLGWSVGWVYKGFRKSE